MSFRMTKALKSFPSMFMSNSSSGNSSKSSSTTANSFKKSPLPYCEEQGSLFAPPHSWFSLPDQIPSDAGKLTVVLDLDETLIHSKVPERLHGVRQDEERKEDDDDDSKVYGEHFDVEIFSEKIRVFKRPGLDEFLRSASRHFELVCFTAGIQEYAEVLIDNIDPHGTIFRHRLYRHHCVQVGEGNFVKDLRVVNRPMHRVVLVDNNAFSFLTHLSNGIPISSFFDDPADSALNVLHEFLLAIKEMSDVREHLKSVFSLENLLLECAKQNLGVTFLQDILKHEQDQIVLRAGLVDGCAAAEVEVIPTSLLMGDGNLMTRPALAMSIVDEERIGASNSSAVSPKSLPLEQQAS